jgi:hypothetical protein
LTEQPVSDIPAMVRQVLGDSLGYLYPAALRVAVRLSLAEALADGPLTPQELASRTGASADHLRRVVRLLATRGVFREGEDGAVHLTPAANLLRPDGPVSVRTMVLLLTDEMYWLSTGRLEQTVRTGETVFNQIFGAPLFDYLLRNEEAGRVFHTGIADLSTIEQEPIAAAYGFPATGTVVDIGGGPGGLLQSVLRRNPGLRGVLFDQDSVLKEHRIDDPVVAGRWETAAGDFFTAVPPGGDIYMLKRVLHDWDDEHSIRILRSCREAMPAHARMLVIDAVVPPGNEPHASKVYDVAMMTIFDGKERTAEEFDVLFAAAGLKAVRVIPTPGTLSIIEAVPATGEPSGVD